MHVVVIGHTRFPLSQPFAGGLEALTWHLVHGLIARGHRVTVFAARGSTPIPGADYLWPEELSLSVAARADVSMPEPGWMERHHAYLQLMIALAQRDDIDVVHTHALHYLPVAMAPSLRAPTVLTLHTPPTPWLESALRASQQTAGVQPTVTAVSAYTARAWSHLVRAHVVPNGIDTDLWRAGPGGGRLVWSGRVVPEKAPHLAARIAHAAGLPLTIAGPVSDVEYARQVLLPLCTGEVEYAGHLHADDLAQLVGTSSAALVTPAWDEPFGLVAAEALACGTPVLGLERGGLPEVVGTDVGRLIPMGDDGAVAPDLLVTRAAELVPEVTNLSRQDCRAYAVERHSIDRMIEAYLRIYENVVEGVPT